MYDYGGVLFRFSSSAFVVMIQKKKNCLMVKCIHVNYAFCAHFVFLLWLGNCTSWFFSLLNYKKYCIKFCFIIIRRKVSDKYLFFTWCMWRDTLNKYCWVRLQQRKQLKRNVGITFDIINYRVCAWWLFDIVHDLNESCTILPVNLGTLFRISDRVLFYGCWNPIMLSIIYLWFFTTPI